MVEVVLEAERAKEKLAVVSIKTGEEFFIRCPFKYNIENLADVKITESGSMKIKAKKDLIAVVGKLHTTSKKGAMYMLFLRPNLDGEDLGFANLIVIKQLATRIKNSGISTMEARGDFQYAIVYQEEIVITEFTKTRGYIVSRKALPCLEEAIKSPPRPVKATK